jgi:hypothetical protein
MKWKHGKAPMHGKAFAGLPGAVHEAIATLREGALK